MHLRVKKKIRVLCFTYILMLIVLSISGCGKQEETEQFVWVQGLEGMSATLVPLGQSGQSAGMVQEIPGELEDVAEPEESDGPEAAVGTSPPSPSPTARVPETPRPAASPAREDNEGPEEGEPAVSTTVPPESTPNSGTDPASSRPGVSPTTVPSTAPSTSTPGTTPPSTTSPSPSPTVPSPSSPSTTTPSTTAPSKPSPSPTAPSTSTPDTTPPSTAVPSAPPTSTPDTSPPAASTTQPPAADQTAPPSERPTEPPTVSGNN